MTSQKSTIKESTKTNAGEYTEKRKFSFTVDGKVNWYNHYGKQYGGISEN